MKDFIVNQLCKSPPDNADFCAGQYDVFLPVVVAVAAILVLTLAFRAAGRVVGKKPAGKKRSIAR